MKVDTMVNCFFKRLRWNMRTMRRLILNINCACLLCAKHSRASEDFKATKCCRGTGQRPTSSTRRATSCLHFSAVKRWTKATSHTEATLFRACFKRRRSGLEYFSLSESIRSARWALRFCTDRLTVTLICMSRSMALNLTISNGVRPGRETLFVRHEIANVAELRGQTGTYSA